MSRSNSSLVEQTTSRLVVPLDRGLGLPLGTQVARGLRDHITARHLSPGDRLPSARAFAADLGVSRSVVDAAFEQLVAEGWLVTRRGAGTFVADTGSPPQRLGGASHRDHERPQDLIRLDAGTPWIDPRFDASWRRAWRAVSVATPPRGYGDPAGELSLRAELAAHLGRTRALAADPRDVGVTHGTTDGLRHLLAVLPPGPVAVEDPGYRTAAALIRATGREVVDVPATDPTGLPDEVVAVYVTPAHQHPLGHVMTATTRVALLARATAIDALVIEDDFDSEFRYDLAPLPALASLDPTRVAYLGTASKSVAPSLRLGWMVTPTSLTEAVNEHRRRTHEAASWPVQHAFAHLLAEGYLDKVVRAARGVYRRRAELVHEALGPHAAPTAPAAGMYSTWRTTDARAAAAVSAAAAGGYEVMRLDDVCRSVGMPGLIIGFGGVDDETLTDALEHLVRGLANP